MALLDLQTMETQNELSTDGGGGGGGGDISSVSLLLCDKHSSNSVLICL
ncbi:SapB/AmfS family lanthipeptide [Streptomyces sp. SBT349]|nr:SapB/AmfS family lanthipeptide [Streptomyces sp. SBT349]